VLYHSAICGAKYSVPQRMAVCMRSWRSGVPGFVKGRRKFRRDTGRVRRAPIVVVEIWGLFSDGMFPASAELRRWNA
jgi:hypothetical protein